MTEAKTPLLLLHGFSQGPSAFDPLRALLPPDRAVIAPFLPGHGETTPAASYEAAVDALAASLPERVEVLGYSLGARVALGLLVRHPERIERATLIGGRPGLPEGPERWARAQWDARWADLLRAEGLPAFVEAWERLPVFADQSPQKREAQRPMRMAHEAEGLARSMETLGLAAMPDYLEALATIEVPCVIAAGENDPKFRRIAEEMIRRLPHATLHTVAGCGHNPMIEAPEKVADLLGLSPRD